MGDLSHVYHSPVDMFFGLKDYPLWEAWWAAVVWPFRLILQPLKRHLPLFEEKLTAPSSWKAFIQCLLDVQATGKSATLEECIRMTTLLRDELGRRSWWRRQPLPSSRK